MNIRKHLGLVIYGGTALALAVVAMVFLVRYLASYAGVMGSLEASKAALTQLNNRKPFPNEANVKLAEANLQNLETCFTNTLGALVREQFVPPRLELAQFPQFLQRSLRGLHEAAVSNNVVTPERFAYGFDRYLRDIPKRTNQLERLERQVHAVDQVCRALFAARIQSMLSLERHVFEPEEERKAAADAAALGGQPMRPEMMAAAMPAGAAAVGSAAEGYYEDAAGMFVRERLIIEFEAKENAIWQALNAIPRLKLFCVVSDIDVENRSPRPTKGTSTDPTRPAGELPPVAGMLFSGPPPSELPGAGTVSTIPAGMAPPPEGALGTNVAARPLRREERVTAGMHEVAKVRLQVDFYTFNKPSPPATEADKKEGQP